MKKIFFYLFFLFGINLFFGQTDDDGFYFDGVDDYINIGGATNTNITNINSTTTNDRTYETWFKAEEVTSRQFIMKEGAGTRAVLVFIEDGYLVVGGYNRADYTPRWEGTFFRKAITADTWYHVALVLDNALAANNTTNLMGANENTTLKFYVDGTLIGENSGYQFGPHNTMRLGYKDASVRFPLSTATWISQLNSEYLYASSALTSYSGTNYFEGYLWGFRLWNRARTATEINEYKADIITTVGTDDLVAILDGDTFEYLANDNTSTSEATVSPVTTIIWSATAASTDWNTGSNWVGGVIPNSEIKEAVQIQEQTSGNNYPIILSSQHIVTGDLKVDSDASITINSGGTLEIAYDLINDGTITVNDTGSLMLREKEASTSAGTFNIVRKTPSYGGNDFYSYWSSPVVSSDSSIATVFPDAELIYSFNSSSSNSDWVFHGTSDFNPGIGYAIQNEATGGQFRTFTGNINKGDIEVSIYNTTNLTGEDNEGNEWSVEGDNLVGNPYPAAIDWDLVVTDPDNTEINGEVYFWNQTTSEVGENNVSDYLVYNLTGATEATKITNRFIGSGQGFFIKTESSESDLKITFKTTHQAAGENANFYKSSNTIDQKKLGRSWFSFSHNDKTNTLLVGFLKGATNEFDRLYDASFDINQTSMGFYTLVNKTNKAAIQGLPELAADEIIIEMGYTVDEIGDYSINIQEE
ncbi:MAG: LamG-like jellyroll fold domain-containing protein, partial [Polaribacter sp.]